MINNETLINVGIAFFAVAWTIFALACLVYGLHLARHKEQGYNLLRDYSILDEAIQVVADCWHNEDDLSHA